MNFSEYLVIYKKLEKPASTFFHKHISKNGAKVFSFLAIKFGLTPNTISILSLILLLIGCLLISTGEIVSLCIAVFILQLSYVCDCSDGVVARFNESSSKFGAYLDILLDRVGGLIFLITITYFSIHYLTIQNEFIFLSSLTIYYFYHLSASFRPYYFPELNGFMKNKRANGSVSSFLRTGVKFTYEFIDTGVFYFIMSLSLILNCVELVVYSYGLLSLLLLSANVCFLYKHENNIKAQG